MAEPDSSAVSPNIGSFVIFGEGGVVSPVPPTVQTGSRGHRLDQNQPQTARPVSRQVANS
jgi:hypothetical protein